MWGFVFWFAFVSVCLFFIFGPVGICVCERDMELIFSLDDYLIASLLFIERSLHSQHFVIILIL